MIKAQVVSKETLAENIVRLKLKPGQWQAWQPGAHLDVKLPNGMERQYSLVPCEEGLYEIAVLKEPASRGGSICIHEDVQTGSEIELSQPKSKFELQQGGRAILLAAGIGITPMLSIADALNAAGVPFEFHYAYRAPAQAAYLDWLARQTWTDCCRHHVSTQGTRLDIGKTLKDLPGDTHVYACGPGGFLETIEAAMSAQDDLDRFHVEYFSNEDLELGGAGFVVKLAHSGQEISVGEDETILAALQREGLDPAYSCEDGVCGTCIVPLLEGEADHRDMYMNEDEQAAQKEIAICCSRARGKSLTIDL